MFTDIARLVFRRRQRQLEQHLDAPLVLQQRVLQQLTTALAATRYGHARGVRQPLDYDAFRRALPVADYDALKADIDRMRHGERDVLWPGRVRWYAKSSGTTNDKSKFIPVSRQGLNDTHYAGGRDSVALYLLHHPQSRLFDGRALILGGSHQPNYNLPGTLVGDLSSILIENINPIVNLVRVPDKHTALLPQFDKKRELIARQCLHADVTNISGVPSWMLSVLVRVMEISGASTLRDVWPNLEVFFHGGIAFTPYRRQYQALLPDDRMHYMETYNASEGFFGLQSLPDDPAMLLMLDYGVFYEFAPMTAIGPDGELTDPTAPIPLADVQPGVNYAMIITTTSGLWRYLIGDTVRFTSTHPYKFLITGRTRSFINAFGEELIVDNAERALAAVCQRTHAIVQEYTAAPVFMDAGARCRHQWLIEFKTPPDDIQQFATLLDQKLQQLNSDYEAKRCNDITLQQLDLVVARPHLFDDWLRQQGKLGGQHKVPRLANTRKHIEQLLALNQ